MILSLNNFTFYRVNEIDFIKAIIYTKGGWKWGMSSAEILVIEPPSNFGVSTWQASKEKGSGGGGVSSL